MILQFKNPRLCLAEILIFSLLVSQALLIFTSASKSSKAANLFRSQHEIALYPLPRLIFEIEPLHMKSM
jgi:hypothetical protein